MKLARIKSLLLGFESYRIMKRLFEKCAAYGSRSSRALQIDSRVSILGEGDDLSDGDLVRNTSRCGSLAATALTSCAIVRRRVDRAVSSLLLAIAYSSRRSGEPHL